MTAPTGRQVAQRATSPCRGCGRPILWITTADGKTVPLDPTPPVYHRVWDPDSDSHFWIRDGSGSGERTAMVSHFSTCPKAGQFSGRNREPQGG